MIQKLIFFCYILVFTNASKPYVGLRVSYTNVNRIVGGINADRGEFPHQISLQRGTPPLLRHRCGGSILNNYWILTAGHCPIGVSEDLYVKAGKHSLKSAEKSEQISKVVKIFVHEKYPGGVAPYDIALLKLKRPLVYNEHVRFIKLPEKDSIAEGKVILSGWGATGNDGIAPPMPDILQKAVLPVVDLKTCQKAIESLTGPSPLDQTNVCTGPLTGGISACSGDSGGPLIKIRHDGQPEVIGIASWAIFPCGTYGAPSVYTRVSAYNDWIYSVMKNN